MRQRSLREKMMILATLGLAAIQTSHTPIHFDHRFGTTLETQFCAAWEIIRGGVMSVTVPDGQRHISATWKDENLWIENYDPKTNICHFSEYSKGNLLQGRVQIKNCNPLLIKE